MSDLRELARPFPDQYVRNNPSGGSYVTHSVVVQRLLSIVGAYDFEIVREVRGYVPAIEADPNAKSKRGQEGRPALDDAVVGVVGRLTVPVDGVRHVIEDFGDCEDPHNWPHDGARAKDAASDAIKRCAARLGLGLHLWAQQDYWLDAWFEKNETSSSPPVPRGQPRSSSFDVDDGEASTSDTPHQVRHDIVEGAYRESGLDYDPEAFGAYLASLFSTGDVSALADGEWSSVRAKLRSKTWLKQAVKAGQEELEKSRPDSMADAQEAGVG